MSGESDGINLGIENRITRRYFTSFLGAAGNAVTLPALVPLGSAFSGNATSINSNSNTKTGVTSYQANLKFLN
jgi:hypothetical protein